MFHVITFHVVTFLVATHMLIHMHMITHMIMHVITAMVMHVITHMITTHVIMVMIMPVHMIMVGHIVVMVVMVMTSEATQKRSMDKYLQKKKQRRLITLGFLFMSQRVMNELSSTPEIAHSPSFLFRLKK